MKRPLFLSLEQVLALHADQIHRYGGSLGIRDLGQLQSALGMPGASFGGQFLHPTLQEMAAAYLFHLTRNHPFVDGNTRIGLAAAIGLLGSVSTISGWKRIPMSSRKWSSRSGAGRSASRRSPSSCAIVAALSLEQIARQPALRGRFAADHDGRTALHRVDLLAARDQRGRPEAEVDPAAQPLRPAHRPVAVQIAPKLRHVPLARQLHSADPAEEEEEDGRPEDDQEQQALLQGSQFSIR